MITKTKIAISINKQLMQKVQEYAKTHTNGKISTAIEKILREKLNNP